MTLLGDLMPPIYSNCPVNLFSFNTLLPPPALLTGVISSGISSSSSKLSNVFTLPVANLDGFVGAFKLPGYLKPR